MLLLAGIIVGALYNPWTGPQTREWLLDQIAGDDDLEPLLDVGESAAGDAAEAAADAADTVEETAAKTKA
jgi:hypothetical protein